MSETHQIQGLISTTIYRSLGITKSASSIDSTSRSPRHAVNLVITTNDIRGLIKFTNTPWISEITRWDTAVNTYRDPRPGEGKQIYPGNWARSNRF